MRHVRLFRLPLILLWLCLLPIAAFAAAPVGPAPVAGTDYVEIAAGEPLQADATPGQIEVVEVFGYTCPHCANFQPLLAEWKAELPGDVRVESLPAPFGGSWIPYARAYLAADRLGVLERSHRAMFQALHTEQRLPLSRPSPEEIAAFYVDYGIAPDAFVRAMAAPEVDAGLERARAFIMRSGVEGTPTLVVDGRYRVRGKNFGDSLRIADHLIARQRAARAR